MEVYKNKPRHLWPKCAGCHTPQPPINYWKLWCLVTPRMFSAYDRQGNVISVCVFCWDKAKDN